MDNKSIEEVVINAARRMGIDENTMSELISLTSSVEEHNENADQE